MARQKGEPVYGGKSKGGSYWLTKVAWQKMRRAAKRTGKSDSDIIEHCLRAQADQIEKGFEALEA